MHAHYVRYLSLQLVVGPHYRQLRQSGHEWIAGHHSQGSPKPIPSRDQDTGKTGDRGKIKPGSRAGMIFPAGLWKCSIRPTIEKCAPHFPHPAFQQFVNPAIQRRSGERVHPISPSPSQPWASVSSVRPGWLPGRPPVGREARRSILRASSTRSPCRQDGNPGCSGHIA